MFMHNILGVVRSHRGLLWGLLLLLSNWAVLFAQADGQVISPSPMGQAIDGAMLGKLMPAIFPNGKGLPKGVGLAKNGAGLYQAQCASCHGKKGEGATAQALIGGDGPLSAPDADKTIQTYWPYATTLFDTIARSMPPAAPGHLTADELYAVCAYLLAENGLWSSEQPMGAQELSSVVMPNRDGFIRRFPPAHN